MPTERTAVYRLYDSADRLLYVGISDNPGRRWKDHHSKPWWSDVARHTLVWYDNRADATSAETKAIRTEAPMHNIAGTLEHTHIGVPPRRGELMGAFEIRERLGVSRQRVQAIVSKKTFPAPAVSLIMGKIWLAADVESWIERNRPGIRESASRRLDDDAEG